MKITIAALVLFIVGCTYKVIPIKGNYSDGNFEATTNKAKDQVWDNIIDFFAKNGLSIKIIDKQSGLIISGNTQMVWTFEDGNGVLRDKSAHVVIHRVINPANKMALTPYRVIGEWNIRIKDHSEGTLININLVNPSYKMQGDVTEYQFAKGAFQSTGVFERQVYEIIK